MSNVASQNRFAFLGNDDDGEEKSTVPVKTVDKPTTRTTKRGVEPQAPQAPTRGHGGGRRGGAHGNEDAFRDRGAGSDRNHRRPLEEAPHDAPRGGYAARTRGGHGSRRPRDFDDRHPSRAGGHGASEKQAAHSWGSPGGDAELKDEEAGEAIAESEQKEALAEDGAPVEPSEPEEKTVSYDDYLAQQAEKKLALDSSFKVREANEGSKLDKKWANAKALEKDEEEFISGHGGKAKRERERKTKQTIDFDPRFVEADRPRGGGRGGRAGRGGRGGERGGDRGRGGHFSGERGRGGERGGYRGGYGGRGGRDGGASAPINTDDKSAFPSLGA